MLPPIKSPKEGHSTLGVLGQTKAPLGVSTWWNCSQWWDAEEGLPQQALSDEAGLSLGRGAPPKILASSHYCLHLQKDALIQFCFDLSLCSHVLFSLIPKYLYLSIHSTLLLCILYCISWAASYLNQNNYFQMCIYSCIEAHAHFMQITSLLCLPCLAMHLLGEDD